MNQPEIANGDAAQLRVFFALRGFQKLRRVAGKEKSLQQFAAHGGRIIAAIELLQFVLRVDQTELADRFPLHFVVFFILGGFKQVLAIPSNHVRAQNGPLDRWVGSRGIDLRQRLAGLRSAEHCQILDGFALEIGIALAARNLAQNFARLRRAALRQDKECLGFFFGRSGGAFEDLAEPRHGAIGVAIHDSAKGQHPELIIFLSFRVNGLPGGLADFKFQRVGVFLPAALWEAALDLGNVGEGGVALAETIFGVGLPIESGVGLGAMHLRQLVELGFSTLIAVFVQRFAAFVVQLGQALEAFLLTVSFFLLAVALFLLAIPGFLFAVALFLLLVLTTLLEIVGFFVAVGSVTCLTFCGGSGLRRGNRGAECSRGMRCKARHRQQKRHYNPSSISHYGQISLAHTLFLSFFAEPFGCAGAFPDSPRCCSSLPTTRTLKRMPRASMRRRMPSNCAGVTCCGLCATSRRTRSSSSSRPASAESPCSSAVCRYSRFSSSKFSARRCSPEMLTCCPALCGPLLASSTRTISERPRCSPTAMTRIRSRTFVWSTATGAMGVPGLVRRAAMNAASTSAAIAPAATQRRGASH